MVTGEEYCYSFCDLDITACLACWDFMHNWTDFVKENKDHP